MKFKDVIRNNPFIIILICLSLIEGGFLFIHSSVLAYVFLAVTVVISVIWLKWFLNTTERKKTEIKTLSQALAPEGYKGNNLPVMPLGVILLSKSGDIVWYNDIFEKYISDLEEFSAKNIGDIFHNLFSENKISSDTVCEMCGTQKKFTVYSSMLNPDMIVSYFVEDTELKNTKLRFELTRPVVLLVNIDSLEQAEDIMPHEDYYGLNSDIDRMVTKWFVENNCVFRKFGDGKFLAITEYSNLCVMISNRFGIIDKVREGHFGNDEVDITLSIGVGHEDDFRLSEDSAREALDMARGRGGDQVALKNGDNYEFFGGITGRKEKRGKVKSRAFAAALDGYIETCSNVLIMGHSFSDFDCIGAACGIAAIARAKNKETHIVVDKQKTMAMPLIEMLEGTNNGAYFISREKAATIARENTLLIIVDTMRLKIVEAPELLSLGLRTVIIDHHRMSVDHISGNAFELFEPHASSTCEMVTELVQYSPSKPKLSPLVAQALLSGIVLDTKNYTLRVSVRTFEAASYLKQCKADTVTVRKLFSGSASENIQVNNTVNSAVYYDRYAVSVCSETGSSARLVASKAADELLCIDGVDASFVLCNNGDTVNISARSLERINVQLIMEKLGGGGHHSMAAAQLTGVNIEQATAELRKAVEEYKNLK